MSTGLGNVFSPEEWVDFVESLGGYVPLPLPDSKYHPGSIISVNYDGPRRGISWLGKLADFDIPNDKLEIVKGDVPGVNLTKGKEFNSEALLHLFGVSAGPSFGRVKKVVLDISDWSTESLDLLKLGHWMKQNQETLSDLMQQLEMPDCFIVGETIMISKGTYTVFDDSNIKINLQESPLSNFLTIQGSLGYSVTNDGKLTFDHPTVCAVRQAVYGGGIITFVKDIRGMKTIDEMIKKLFLEQAPMK